ncbi:Ribokinase-like protein [Tribonema minus]|uniref:Ribokinase-like protein n=1 Tax=Tribonema minus TaxID=303371 RepID=A0A836CC38_9STRA|nr:Ribokinase-like protein [Tribonema minus]
MAIDAQGVARLPGFATPCLKITYDGETMKWEPTAGWDRWVELQQTDLPLPPHYAHAQVVHVLTEADGMAETRMACTLKAERLDAILSVEPVLFDLPNVMATVTGLLPLLSAADVVSPDWPAACAIAGADAASADPEAVLRGCRSRMQLKGGALLAVRCGSRGSYLLWGTRAERWAHVPAFPLPDPVQDPTGAGNAYCGALAACLARGGPGALADTARVLKAAAQASATGAAVVQVDGLPELGAALNAQLSRYCDDIASRTRILSVP